jgi:hypothetical protein
MFYSRPKIDPLGWDLTDWPTPNGSRYFEAFTAGQRPVSIRFGGGWLSVERGPKGASLDSPDMEEVLCLRIAPFGTMDIEPEQICDILGVTVNGNRIDSAGVRTGARGFDWSGRTTYWESTHLMQPDGDAREFVQKLCDAFPGSILVQPEWGSGGRARCRQIKFLMASHRVAALGIGPHDARLRTMLTGQRITTEEFESTFAYCIDFVRDDSPTDDPTGARYIHTHGAKELDLQYDVTHHRRYRIRVQFLTGDAAAQSRTKTLLSLIDASFCRGLEAINLQTGDVITEDLADATDERSYSVALRDEWLTKPDRYFLVGRSVAGDDSGWAPGTFWGARPNAAGRAGREMC